MITGIVTEQYDAVIELSLFGSRQQKERFDAVIDTGFNGWLTLPPAMIREFGLRWRRRGLAYLADGSSRFYDIYAAEIFWNRHRIQVDVDECDTTPLIGMRLLDGHDVRIWVGKQGRVEIRRWRNGTEKSRP